MRAAAFQEQSPASAGRRDRCARCDRRRRPEDSRTRTLDLDVVLTQYNKPGSPVRVNVDRALDEARWAALVREWGSIPR